MLSMARHIGAKAMVKIGTEPDRDLTGEVIYISPFPEQRSWSDDRRYYAVQLSLENAPERIQIGASATVKIEVAQDE